MLRVFVAGVCIAVTFWTAAVAHAQGVQTGTVTGVVQSSDGRPLPGVTVSATSATLQQGRTTVTDRNGIYTLPALPPGSYEITFALANFQNASRSGVAVSIGAMTELNATMSLEGQRETITVTAEAPPLIAGSTTSATYTKTAIDALPVGRRPAEIAEFAPGVVTRTTMAAGQVSISGGFAFDNVFMVDGVDVNDNILGTANDLFIEDAVEQISVLAHGIPASYGRFTGGVVNVVTKSGGNTFSGSFRLNLSNPAWIEETPRQVANGVRNASVLNKTHEATFGGPIVTDRLWFFAAGRYEKMTTQNTFTQTRGAYTRADSNRRGELKITGTLAPGHTVQGTYINNATENANMSGLPAAALVDASTLITRQAPNDLLGVNYNGVVSSSAVGTLQYSHKRQQRRNNGGLSADIFDSPFITLGATHGVPGSLFYHAPYFDATDPEDRNNRQFTGQLSYLLSTASTGTHDLKAGVEHFVSTGIGGNSQSASGYVFATDYVVDGGRPVLDASGRPIPRFVPGVSEVWNFQATRGARIDIETTSLYIQDRWMVGPRLTLELGTRLESVRSDATGDITTLDSTSIVPRLGAAFDVRGDGRTIVQTTYAHYSGKYNQVQFSANTNVGRPSEVDYVYNGPAGQGSDFAPGFDIRNYTDVVYANFPTANVKVADGIRSPVVREFTTAVGHQVGSNADVRATYAWRTTSNFVEDFLDRSTGVTSVPHVGLLTTRVFDNTDDAVREYQALLLQGTYRPHAAATIGGHYTVQLRNNGNFVGETASQPGVASILGNYPEIFGSALDRLMPEGRLDGYERHKLRIYGMYTQRLGRLGAVDIAPLWRLNSGAAYSHTATIPVTAVQLSRNPGYPSNDINHSVRQTIFFGDRGEQSFKGYGALDLASTYGLPVWKAATPWVKVEFYNLLNNQKQIAWDRTVTVDQTSPRDANGIPTGFVRGPRYGQATADNQFPQPYPGQNGGRAFRMALGFRF